MLENLKKEYPALEENLEKTRHNIQLVEEKLGDIDIASVSERARILSNEITNLEKQISSSNSKRKNHLKKLRKSEVKFRSWSMKPTDREMKKRTSKAVYPTSSKKKEKPSQLPRNLNCC